MVLHCRIINRSFEPLTLISFTVFLSELKKEEIIIADRLIFGCMLVQKVKVHLKCDLTATVVSLYGYGAKL